MTKPRVLVTRRWPDAVEAKMAQAFDLHLNASDQPLSQADLRDAMGQYDAILPTVTDRLPAAVFDGSTTRTRILAKSGLPIIRANTLMEAAERAVTAWKNDRKQNTMMRAV